MSEIINIPLGGVSNEPNDYGSEDGALSLSLNAVKHHGSIRPVMPGSPVKDIGEEGLLPVNTDVVAIHEVGDMKHYILLEEIEKQAGSRPVPGQTIDVTVHYICKEKSIIFWWTSNFADYCTDMLLHLKVGVGLYWEPIELHYARKEEIAASGIAVTAHKDVNGEIIGHTMYDYNDTRLHIDGTCLSVSAITDIDGSSLGEQLYTVTYQPHVDKTDINITVLCTPNDVRIGYKSSGYYNIGSMRMSIGQGKSYETRIYSEQVEVIPAELLYVDEDEEGLVKYSYPDSVLTVDMIGLLDVYRPSDTNPIAGLLDSNGNFTDNFSVTFNMLTTEDTDADIPTGSDSFSPDSKEDATYRLSYRDVTQKASDPVLITDVSGDAISVTPMGNVLTVAAKDKPFNYIIWKDGEYIVLGNALPELNCKASLQSKVLTAGGIANTLGITFSENLLNLYDKDKPELSGAVASSINDNVPYTTDMQAFVYDKVFGAINSVHKAMTREGLFYASFYMRMAYRMFDGTYVMHTPPKLMIVNSAGHPFFMLKETTGDDKVVYATLVPFFPCSRLTVEIPAIEDKWEDLIAGIDIFVTPPIVSYSDSPESIIGTREITGEYALTQQSEDAMCSVLDFTLESDQAIAISDIVAYKDVWYRLPSNLYSAERVYVIPEGRESDFDIENYTEHDYWDKNTAVTYTENKTVKFGDMALPAWLKKRLDDGGTIRVYLASAKTKFEYNSLTKHVTFIGIFPMEGIVQLGGEGTTRILAIRRPDSNFYETNLVEENRFYRVKSIPFADIRNGWSGEVASREHALDNLEQQPDITDNGQSRTKVVSCIKPLAYNSRLSVVAKRVSLPSTCDIDYFTSPPWKDSTTGVKYQKQVITKAWVKGIVNTQTVYTQVPVAYNAYADGIRQFFYPDYDATQLILSVINIIGEEKSKFGLLIYNLQKHKLLNGTYLFDSFKVVQPAETREYQSKDQMLEDPDLKNAMEGATEATYGNMVRVSGVSNPFYFNEVNQVTLPTGTISGLSTTARALSQGQFGAFPLYCFSDNGIWALEVSDTGTYSAKQPVSRAVCTNPESITQTEGQVLFVTKRGLMALDGSSVTCLSEILSGHNYTSTLSKLYEVKTLVGLEDVPDPDTHIEEWLQDARLLYDDKRQMLYAFNEEDVLGYVYSISDQAWGMMVHDLAHPLPCYTDALAVTREDTEGVRRLINMSDPAPCGSAPKALLITRPLSMGVPDGYKTLEALVTRGMLDKDDAKLVIWASNDLKKWAIIATSKTSWYRGMSGTPYKYFRIGLLLDWEEQDSVNGLGADITPRLNNRLR